MIPDTALWLEQMDRCGFLILPGVFTPVQVQAILAGLDQAFQKQAQQVALRSDGGSIYAARNILSLWAEPAAVWRQPPLQQVLRLLLGPRFGLVRALFFDKPPDQTWTLPWHKDLTIAVRDQTLRSQALVGLARRHIWPTFGRGSARVRHGILLTQERQFRTMPAGWLRFAPAPAAPDHADRLANVHTT